MWFFNLFQSSVQSNKFQECLMYVNNDLGILLQNAENLAYKLGVIKKEEMKYLSYDYYNQFEQKDIGTLKKNIISSIKFLKAQFIAIKQETGKDYIYPPSIEEIIKDVIKWKELIKEKSPTDLIYFKNIYSLLNKGKSKNFKDSENIYQDCINNNKKTNITPYMWMYYSPQILHNIDKNNEIIQNKMDTNGQSNPDIIRGPSQTYKDNLIKTKEIYKEIQEINAMINNLKENKDEGKKIDEEQIKLKIEEFISEYKQEPFIEKENQKIYGQLIDFK